jgi:hypothetical protein
LGGGQRKGKGLSGHDSTITVSTWENQQVMLKTIHSEKWWQIHLFATWTQLTKNEQKRLLEENVLQEEPLENAHSDLVIKECSKVKNKLKNCNSDVNAYTLHKSIKYTVHGQIDILFPQ